MPPRRSSRAPSAAAEPISSESLPAKRKRGSTAEPVVEEKENNVKPASRTRKSTSVKSSADPPSKGRRTTRAKTSLPDVAESENEEQSDAPPVKRARPSTDSVKVEQKDEEETVPEKPKRGRRTASVQAKAAEMDVDDEAQSKTTGRRTSTRKSAVSSGSRTSVGSARSAVASGSAIVEEPEDAEEEDVKPLKGHRAPAKGKTGKRVLSKAIQSDEEVEPEPAVDAMSVASEYEEEPAAKPSKGRKGKAPAARKGKATAKKPVKTVTIENAENEDDDLELPPPAQSRARAPPIKKPAINMAPEAEDEGEEEKSLFEPPPMPAPSSLPTTMPEEPSGPKSRLVIHKMALVNFKSYAGRQEIGPFHKVSHQFSTFTFSDSSSVVLFHCWTQWIREVEHYRCAFIRLRIPRFQDETRKDIRAYSQLCQLPRSG